MNIKFRIWDNEISGYFEPTYEAYNGKLEYLMIGQKGDVCMVRMKADKQLETVHESCWDNRFKKEIFTGILDKNKAEIYLNDICELEVVFNGSSYNEGDDAFHYVYTGVVKYSPSLGFYLKIFKCFDVDNQEKKDCFVMKKPIVSYRTKIIGNINQNHELLTI